MHRAGIVHRDIKPFNLLVTDEDRLKIGDFGVSKLRGDCSATPSNLLVGSPYYAAPEQERDPGGVDGRADLYSAGVVLYRMLTGRQPEDGGPGPGATHPDATPAWDEFVFRALETNPGRRFADAPAMLVALEKLSDDWKRRRDAFCSLDDMDLPGTPAARIGVAPIGDTRIDIIPLRHNPLRVKPKDAPGIFASDALLRPLQPSLHEFAPSSDGAVVLDRLSNLSWQRAGSEDPVPWERAQEYVDRLNALRFAGRSDWRLPTVNELFSLLKPVALGKEDCLEGVFDRRRWIWSCDRRSFTAAWYVDCEPRLRRVGGFFLPVSRSCRLRRPLSREWFSRLRRERGAIIFGPSVRTLPAKATSAVFPLREQPSITGGRNVKSFLLGMLTLAIVIVAGSAAAIWLRVFDVAANVPHWEATSLILEAARDFSVTEHARGIKLPPLDDPALIKAGAAEFQKTCRVCHGAPGQKRENFAKGMYPHPPSLASGDVQTELTPAEIYWIVKNGLKMTGMPAFSASEDEKDILGSVAFVKKLKDMQPDEYNTLIGNTGKGQGQPGAAAPTGA